MKPLKPKSNIAKAWAHQNTLLEFYRYTPQKPEKVPAHCHAQYQFCLSTNYPSEYCYRKSIHFAPVGSLNIIHPGEMHSGTGRDVGDRQTPAIFHMMYVEPTMIHQVLEDVFEQKSSLPFFANSVILDDPLTRLFLSFHQASQDQMSWLEQDERLQSFLMMLIRKYGDSRLTVKSAGRTRLAVQRVREYLHEHYAENVTLKQLAQIAHLSPSYFSRVFKAEMGVSLPHYQSQVRVNQARALLLKGMSIKQVAANTGFVDQSHFTHHFKRFAQVTPGNYIWKDRKNLQDFSD